MINYFLAPRSGEKSHENFKSTIRHGIPLERISNFLNKSEIEILNKEDVIYAWGNRKGTSSSWEKMKEGDIVIFYAKKKLIMSGEVYFKKHSPQMALEMWPADEKGNPWEYTFFLKNLKYFSMPISSYISTVEFQPRFIVQGFMPIKKESLDRIIKKYGSVEQMLGQFADNNSEEIPLMDDRLYVNLSKEVTPTIIENIDLHPTIKKELSLIKKQNRKKINYQERNKKNAIMGSKGEHLVYIQEKKKLQSLGKYDLANKVDRVSLRDDSLGYDILSFEPDGTEKFIEVKTTNEQRNIIRFFVSSNEYAVGEGNSNYHIYIVENIDSDRPVIIYIKNPIDKLKFNIWPDTYIFEAEKKLKKFR